MCPHSERLSFILDMTGQTQLHAAANRVMRLLSAGSEERTYYLTAAWQGCRCVGCGLWPWAAERPAVLLPVAVQQAWSEVCSSVDDKCMR